MKSIILPAFLFSLFFLFCLSSFGQEQPRKLGFSVTGERTNEGTIVPGFGISYEEKSDSRSAFETGLFFRSFHQPMITQTMVDTRGYIAVERYLSIPLLYKYNAPAFNFSVGVNCDFYLGWKNKKPDDVNVIHLEPNGYDHVSFAFGVLGKIGKTFNISETSFIEPDVRYNYIFSHNRSYLGFGISLKKRLN